MGEEPQNSFETDNNTQDNKSIVPPPEISQAPVVQPEQPAQSLNTVNVPDEQNVNSVENLEQPVSPFGVPAENAVPALASVIMPTDPVSQTAGIELPKKKSKKKLLILGISSLLVVLVSSLASAYFFWYQAPQKVVNDAVASLVGAKSVSFKLGATSSDNANSLDFNIDGSLSRTAVLLNLEGSYTADGSALPIEGGLYATIDNGGGIMLKVKDVEKIMDKSLGAYASIYKQVFAEIIAKVDNKWISITQSDVSDFSGSNSTTNTCVKDAGVKLKTNIDSVMSKIVEAYGKYPVLVAGDSVGSKSIGGVDSVGYKVTADNKNIAMFVKELGRVDEIKAYGDCDNSYKIVNDDVDKYFANNSNITDTNFEIWAGRISHSLTQVTVTASDKSSDATITFQPVISNQADAVKAPTPDVTTNEIKDMVQNVFGSFSG